jgi:hypothetical protein
MVPTWGRTPPFVKNNGRQARGITIAYGPAHNVQTGPRCNGFPHLSRSPTFGE